MSKNAYIIINTVLYNLCSIINAAVLYFNENRFSIIEIRVYFKAGSPSSVTPDPIMSGRKIFEWGSIFVVFFIYF